MAPKKTQSNYRAILQGPLHADCFRAAFRGKSCLVKWVCGYGGIDSFGTDVVVDNCCGCCKLRIYFTRKD